MARLSIALDFAVLAGTLSGTSTAAARLSYEAAAPIVLPVDAQGGSGRPTGGGGLVGVDVLIESSGACG